MPVAGHKHLLSQSQNIVVRGNNQTMLLVECWHWPPAVGTSWQHEVEGDWTRTCIDLKSSFNGLRRTENMSMKKIVSSLLFHMSRDTLYRQEEENEKKKSFLKKILPKL